MKRILLAAAVGIPVAVVAAIATAPSGKVVDLDNYNATAATSYINDAQCKDSAAAPLLNLEWSTVTVDGGTSSGTYKIIASNTGPAASTGDGAVANFCPEIDDLDATPDVFAKQVDSAAWTSNIQGKQVSGSAAAAAAHADCSASGEGSVVYVCAHLYEADQKRGYASGKFIVQVAAPPAPTGVNAGPASETSLSVTWTAPTSGVQVDHYEAVATVGTEEHRSGTTTATNATISGLTEGTTYSVVVFAYSLGGNPSVASGAIDATPAPVDDFWETYIKAGGTDGGGCASGPAGPLALLAVAGLVLLRRRK